MPLEGLTVLEVAQALSGPVAGMHLADYGANVIKVEPPQGDLFRKVPPSPEGSRMAAAHISRSFVRWNRNKRSMVLDLRLDKGRQVLKQMAATADVLIENLRPGEMEKLGLGYEDIKAINPRLIYASISAYGHKGPEFASPGYDPLAAARSGVVASRRYPDGTPVPPGLNVIDESCAVMVAYAIVMSVLEREKSGLGQKIEASLLGTAVDLNASNLVRMEGDGPSASKPKLEALSSPYRCADGRFIFITTLTDKPWQAICKAAELSHLLEDGAFRTALDRSNNAQTLHSILESVFISRSASDWFNIFQRVGVPCALVLERDEVFDDPQVMANQFIIEHQHPLIGKVKMAGLPFSLSRTKGDIRFPAPALGEHTQEVLEELGYLPEQISELEEQGVTRALP